jgi:hypothetical protein
MTAYAGTASGIGMYRIRTEYFNNSIHYLEWRTSRALSTTCL